jgi:hypothetical protein
MTESEVVRELSRRTGLSESATGVVFNALRSLIREGVVDEALLHDAGATAPPRLAAVDPRDPSLVEELIARARKHPRGIEFLLSGLLGTVAIALGAHAFTVEAARARLRKEKPVAEEVEVS